MSLPKPWSLSVKIVLLDKEGRCLLLRRSMASKGNPGRWDLPGGKMDVGETFDQTLLREVKEETGLEAVITGVVGNANSESDTRRIVYLIMEGQVQTSDVRLSDEHMDYTWVEPGRLAEMDIVTRLREVVEEYARKKR